MSGSLYISRAELVDALGDQVTEELLAALGGETLYVTSRPRRNNRIVGAIGAERMTLLAQYVGTGRGGLWITLPRPRRTNVDRVVDALARGAAGGSERDIARALDVHPRTVRRARARLRAATA